jgi:hypothetical protein
MLDRVAHIHTAAAAALPHRYIGKPLAYTTFSYIGKPFMP